jgi:hypothetical protein
MTEGSTNLLGRIRRPAGLDELTAQEYRTLTHAPNATHLAVEVEIVQEIHSLGILHPIDPGGA